MHQKRPGILPFILVSSWQEVPWSSTFPRMRSRSMVAMPQLLQAPGSEAGQCLPLSNKVSMLSHCRTSRPVTVRRKSGAPLTAYSTIP